MPETPVVRVAVEFYAIELSRLADGATHVHMVAVTVDDEEPQLLSQEIVAERVPSIDDALITIKEGVRRTEGP